MAQIDATHEERTKPQETAFLGPIQGHLKETNGMQYYVFDLNLEDPSPEAIGRTIRRLQSFPKFRPVTLGEKYVVFMNSLRDRFVYGR